jgi:predicted negative regulator of RcsB-dependent stress response
LKKAPYPHIRLLLSYTRDIARGGPPGCITPANGYLKELLLGAKKIKVVKKSVKTTEPTSLDSPFERLTDWIEENSRFALGVALMVIIVLALSFGVRVYVSREESGAREAFVQVLSKISAAGAGGNEALEKIVPELEGFVRQYSGTAPGLDARFELQKAFFQLKRYEDSLKAGTELLDKLSADHPLRPLVIYQIALASQSAGKTDQALTRWREVRESGYVGVSREADWNMARLYAAKQDYAQAVVSYESAIKTEALYPETALLEQELAAVRIRMGAPGPK